MIEQNDRNITISLTVGTVVKTILIIASFYFVYQFIDLVLVILTAVVLASAIEPATKYFCRYKIPRVLAVISIYAAVIIFFSGVLYLFVPPVVDDITNIDQKYNISVILSEYVSKDDVSSLDNDLIQESFSLKSLLIEIKNAVSGAPEKTIQTIGVIFGSVFSFMLILVFSFYLAVQKDGIADFLRIVTPNKHEEYIIDIWRRTQLKIGLWMQGQLLLGLIIGVLVYLGLTLIGVPYALVLALLAAAFEIIPIFGPVLAAIPPVVLAFQGGTYFSDPGLTSATVVVLFYVIIQQFENHLIYPLVVRKVVGVPPLFVIISLVIGIKTAGFLGVILAVPVAAALMEFANDIQKEKHLARQTK